MTSTGVDVPHWARVSFTHAVVQVLADQRGVDVLHIKGPAIDPGLTSATRAGTDADVLVRPSQAAVLVETLRARGWRPYTGFETGSPFQHAVTLKHELWGYADIHRVFPGVTVEPESAFERLWRERATKEIAGVRCPVPSIAGQVMVLVLNAARPGGHGTEDLETAWTPASPELEHEVRALVDELGAEVAFAAATGDLERFRDHRGYDLWRVVSQGGTRIEEWRARVKAAPSRREALRLVLRAPLVNVEHLGNRLGRPPTRREVVEEFFARPARGVVEQSRAFRSRRARERHAR